MAAFRSLAPILFATGLAAAAGCQGQVVDAQNSGGNGPGAGTTVAGDLPCDVATVLGDSCVPCHSDPPIAGVPMALTSYAALTAPSKSNPSVTVAELSLTRMQDAQTPMPPTGMLPAADIAAFSAWIAAGMPLGTCGAPTDGGIPQFPLVCTSGSTWSQGDLESPFMHPGGMCITCHTIAHEGPLFRVAGTVYPSPREPDDCNGAPSITVVVTDGLNRTVTLTTNAAGNFFYEDDPAKFVPPFMAKVVAGGKERAMKQAVETGDCNSCHTQDGKNGAPGRIYAP